MKPETDNCTSCVGCKFLYTEGRGYSNYTWEETVLKCALDKNPNLNGQKEIDVGCDWTTKPDNHPATKNSRCSCFAEGRMVDLDVDGENKASDFTNDAEAIAVISKHSGREE